MAAWYNENDKNAAAWLRELIARGLIAPGVVDERSIADVRADDLKGFTQCHFFAGIGGWSYALRLALWPDDRPVWTGSCPCQPFSAAGKRKGFNDDRHLWPIFQSLIEKCRPATIFGEQVAAASDWLRLVRGDLEALGYAVGAMPVEAASAGADHLRDRFWFVAVADADNSRSQGRFAKRERADQRAAGSDGVDVAEPGCNGARRRTGSGAASQGTSQRLHWRASRTSFTAGVDGEGRDLVHADQDGQPGLPEHAEMGVLRSDHEWVIGADGKARRVKPGVRLLAHGFPHRVGLLRGFGNAIDPRPAAAFIKAADEAMSAHTRPEAA